MGCVWPVTDLAAVLGDYEGAANVVIHPETVNGTGFNESEIPTLGAALQNFNTDFTLKLYHGNAALYEEDRDYTINNIQAGAFARCAHLKEVQYYVNDPTPLQFGTQAVPDGTKISLYDWDQTNRWHEARSAIYPALP